MAAPGACHADRPRVVGQDSHPGAPPPRASLHVGSFSPRAFAPKGDDVSRRRDQSIPSFAPSPLSSSSPFSFSRPPVAILAQSVFPRGASAPGQIGRRCSAASLACSARSAPCLRSRDSGAQAETIGPEAVVSSSLGCVKDYGEGVQGDAGMQRRLQKTGKGRKNGARAGRWRNGRMPI